MGKKTISNTFTVNTIIDGESAPYYFQEWFAWSNDASTSGVTTPPTIGGSWATSIPSQGSYAYLWRKSIRYVWNENTRQYSAEAAQYFRMSGTDGTSIRTRGQVANASSRGNGTATIITDSGTQTITLSDGDAVTQLDNGHLFQWVTEGGGKWLDLGQFKGESGKTYYTHIAWATNVNYNSSGVVTRVDGFTIDKSPNDTTHLWMGVLVNQDSSTDSSAALDYTWSYTKGVDGFSVQAQYAPNNNPSSSQIHNTWQNGDIYMRTKQSNETNWSSWNRIVGESGGETNYQFAISANKVTQDGTSATAPSDIPSSAWQDSPMSTTTQKPYLWSKVQKKDGGGNNVGNPSYMRLTGEESIEYSVEGALNTIKVGAGQTSTLVSCTYTFYKKPAVSSTRSTVSCYYAVYLRSGNTFSLLTMGTGYNNHGSGTSVTVSSNVPYKSGSIVYNAVVIYIFPSSYYSTSPESQNYMAKKEIPIVKDGDTAFVVDLENEMTNVALTEGGNTLTAVDFYFKVRAFYGTLNVLSDNECTVGASCSDSNVTLTTTAAKTTGIRVQVAQNVALANSTNITVTVAHTTYGTRTVIFTLAGVRGGENAVLQELLPSLDAISFARTASGGLTPSSRDLTLSIKKTQGGSTSTQSISDSGLTIRWSSTSMPASKTGGNGWGNGTATGISWNNTTMQIANTVAATNIYIAAFNSVGTLVDRETIPVIKDGKHGTSPYFADLNNEMDAIQCKHDGGVIADQTVSTVISMWKGSAVEPFAVDNIYRNGTQLTWDGNNSGVWPRIIASGSTVSIEFDTSASIADIDDFKITIHSTNDTSVTRELHFTVNGVRSNAIYRLVPSHSQIVKKKDGTYEPSVNVTCSVKKNENGSTSTPSSSEYTLEKSVNGGSYEAYSATAPSSITSDLKFRLKVGGVVVDLETIPLVSDGNNGDGGVSYSFVFTKAAARVDENNIVTAELAGYAYKYVGGVRSALTNTTIRYGYILTDSDTYADKTTNSSGFFDAGTWFNGDDITDLGKNSPSIFAAIIIGGTVVHAEMITISVKGNTGNRGKVGRFFYFGGTFNAADTTQTFIVNDAQAPYFEHSETVTTQSGTTTIKRYHVFNYDTNGKYTMAQMWAISSNWNNKPWESMTNDFKYIITEAIFGAYAHFGANIINGDYRLSQYGYMRGFYDSKVSVNSGTQYIYFDDSDPFGDEDMFSKSENMVANHSLSDYEIPDSTHYVILGNNIEFAPSSSPESYQIENTFTSSCNSYRFKTNDRWGSWYDFSSASYYFALSESGVSAPTSGWSYSRLAQNLVPTASKPYLWARLGTSGTPFLASSPQKSFTIEKGRYYAISIGTENYDAGNFNIRIGTKNSHIDITSGSLKKELIGDALTYYGIFISDRNSTNANLWTDKSGLSFTFEAVYKAQFVPMLCEDLKTGKLVVNNVVARGELHADSLYYSMYNEESNNGTIVVKDKSIVSIGTNGVGSVVKLPSPSASKGRKVEVYNYATSWKATWDGATSASKFSCPYGSGLGYRTDTSITNKYVIFYCDGSKWWILRAEN